MEKENNTTMTGRYVFLKLNEISKKKSEAERKATLANLRHGAGKRPGEIPKIWGEYLLDLPEQLMGNGKEPGYAEWAIYLALTMYATHQQGKDIVQSPMNVESISIGKALGMLAKKESDLAVGRDRVLQRFYPMSTADDMEKLAHYLRGIIQLLRTENIPLDYPKLAEDLYLFQFENIRSNVRLKWGEDFYREIRRTNDDDKETKNDEK